MASRMRLTLIDFTRRATQLSLVGPAYAADGSDKAAKDTLWDNLRLGLVGITQGTQANFSIASTYDDVANPATPDPGAQRKQEWVLRFNVPGLATGTPERIVSIGTADTDDVPVIVSNGITIADPASPQFSSLKSAWDVVVKYEENGLLYDTVLVSAEFRTVR